jgi:hypothetical protein
VNNGFYLILNTIFSSFSEKKFFGLCAGFCQYLISEFLRRIIRTQVEVKQQVDQVFLRAFSRN